MKGGFILKETIYTIPVTDAFNTPCECPICVLEKNLENKYMEYTLGAAMMEPDERIKSNKKGYCKKHFTILSKQNNNLSLALIIDTHLKENNELLSSLFDKIQENKKQITKSFIPFFFKKRFSQDSSIKYLDKLIDYLENFEKSCVICDKINDTMQKYMEVIFYLWKKEKGFKDMFANGSGFCIKHFKTILINAKKQLPPKELNGFLDLAITLQNENLKRIQDEVNWFTKKFDYKNNNAPWKNSKDVVKRSIEKIVGYLKY